MAKITLKEAIIKRCKEFIKYKRKEFRINVRRIVNKALDIKFHNISELKSDEIAALCLDLWVIMILEDKSKKIIKAWTKKYKKKYNTEEFALTSLWLKYYDRFRTMLLQGHTSIKNFMEDL